MCQMCQLSYPLPVDSFQLNLAPRHWARIGIRKHHTRSTLSPPFTNARKPQAAGQLIASGSPAHLQKGFARIHCLSHQRGHQRSQDTDCVDPGRGEHHLRLTTISKTACKHPPASDPQSSRPSPLPHLSFFFSSFFFLFLIALQILIFSFLPPCRCPQPEPQVPLD